MITELREPPKPGIASLVGGIVQDAEHLAKQQVDLVKQEIRNELQQAKRAAISASLGFAVAAIGAIFLLHTAALAINTYSTLPLWVCYGIVGGITAVIGAGLIFLAKKEASDVQLLPPPETAGAIKENYQWMTGQRDA